MPEELSKLFADLDAAKVDLQRQVRHSRAFLAEHGERLEADRTARALFGWAKPTSGPAPSS